MSGSVGRIYTEISNNDSILTIDCSNITISGECFINGNNIGSLIDTSNAHYLLINAGDISKTNLDISQNLNVLGETKLEGDVDISGTLKAPANFVIDPAAVGDNTGKVSIKGDLEVLGTTTTINSQQVDISDNVIKLASNVSGPPSGLLESGIEVERGDSDNAKILWLENTDKFELREGSALTKLNVGELQINGSNVSKVHDASWTATDASLQRLLLMSSNLIDTSNSHWIKISEMEQTVNVTEISCNLLEDISTSHWAQIVADGATTGGYINSLVDTSNAHYAHINSLENICVNNTARLSTFGVITNNIDASGLLEIKSNLAQSTGSYDPDYLGISGSSICAYDGGSNDVIDLEISGNLVVKEGITSGGFTLPTTIGTEAQVLSVPSSGTTLEWVTQSGGIENGSDASLSNLDASNADISYLTINNAYTFPTAIGTESQVLTVPSSGTTLEWANQSGGGGAALSPVYGSMYASGASFLFGQADSLSHSSSTWYNLDYYYDNPTPGGSNNGLDWTHEFQSHSSLFNDNVINFPRAGMYHISAQCYSNNIDGNGSKWWEFAAYLNGTDISNVTIWHEGVNNSTDYTYAATMSLNFDIEITQNMIDNNRTMNFAIRALSPFEMSGNADRRIKVSVHSIDSGSVTLAETMGGGLSPVYGSMYAETGNAPQTNVNGGSVVLNGTGLGWTADYESDSSLFTNDKINFPRAGIYHISAQCHPKRNAPVGTVNDNNYLWYFVAILNSTVVHETKWEDGGSSTSDNTDGPTLSLNFDIQITQDMITNNQNTMYFRMESSGAFTVYEDEKRRTKVCVHSIDNVSAARIANGSDASLSNVDASNADISYLTINNAYTLPTTIGTASQVLTVPASGTTLEWANQSGGGGGGSSLTVPSFSATGNPDPNSGHQGSSSTPAIISNNMTTMIVNVDNCYKTSVGDPDQGNFVAPVAGNYFFSAGCLLRGNGTGQLSFYKNGSNSLTTDALAQSENNGDSDNISITAIIPLDVGDKVAVYGHSLTGSSDWYWGGGLGNFSGYLIDKSVTYAETMGGGLLPVYGSMYASGASFLFGQADSLSHSSSTWYALNYYWDGSPSGDPNNGLVWTHEFQSHSSLFNNNVINFPRAGMYHISAQCFSNNIDGNGSKWWTLGAHLNGTDISYVTIWHDGVNNATDYTYGATMSLNFDIEITQNMIDNNRTMNFAIKALSPFEMSGNADRRIKVSVHSIDNVSAARIANGSDASLSNVDVSNADISYLTINNAYTLPTTIGTASQVLTVPSSGTTLEWAPSKVYGSTYASGGTAETNDGGDLSLNTHPDTGNGSGKTWQVDFESHPGSLFNGGRINFPRPGFYNISVQAHTSSDGNTGQGWWILRAEMNGTVVNRMYWGDNAGLFDQTWGPTLYLVFNIQITEGMITAGNDMTFTVTGDSGKTYRIEGGDERTTKICVHNID